MTLVITFIHLGSFAPKYMWLNIERVRENFPNYEIVVISNISSNLQKANNMGIQSFYWAPSIDIESLFIEHSYDKRFRQGFWQYSTMRLFALAAISMTRPSEKFLHIESDVILFPNFPVAKIEEIEKLSWFRYNDERDIGALVLIPNGSLALWLHGQITKLLQGDHNLTDMTILNVIEGVHPEKVYLFPQFYNEYKYPSQDEYNFTGRFDGASLGMWLLGLDPRNHHGFIPRYFTEKDAYVRANEFRLSMSEGIISVTHNNVHYEVYNLHVHCKQLKYFSSKRDVSLEYAIRRSQNRQFSISFSPLAAISIINATLRERGLVGFGASLWKLIARKRLD